MGGPALKVDRSNLADVVNAVFDTAERRHQYDLMNGRIAAGADTHCFVDEASREIVLKGWLAAWQKHAGEVYRPVRPGRKPRRASTTRRGLRPGLTSDTQSETTPGPAGHADGPPAGVARGTPAIV